MKRNIGIGLAILIGLFPTISKAQFDNGSGIIGPHVGISNVTRATVLGIKFETGIAQIGTGVIGLDGTVDYYSFNGGDFGSQSYIFFIVSALYHLRIDDGSFDPFIGIGAGYLSERNTFLPVSGITYYNTDGSGFRPVISIGARYFLSRSIAIRLEFGTALVYAVGGVDFGF